MQSWLKQPETHLTALFKAGRLPNVILFTIPRFSKIDVLFQTLTDNTSTTKNNTLYTNPNILYEKDDTSEITIEKIHHIRKSLTLTPYYNEPRFIILESVERLNESSANALLKTLEELKTNCYFLLSCENTKNIIPTILSRSIQYKIPISFAQFIDEYSHTISAHQKELTYEFWQINRNQVETTLKWLENPDLIQTWHQISFQSDPLVQSTELLKHFDIQQALQALSLHIQKNIKNINTNTNINLVYCIKMLQNAFNTIQQTSNLNHALLLDQLLYKIHLKTARTQKI